MNITFQAKSTDEARLVVISLANALISAGVPKNKIEVHQSNDENMDLGSILTLDWKLILDFVLAAGNIAELCNNIFDILGRFKCLIKAQSESEDVVTFSKDDSIAEINLKFEKLIMLIESRSND